MSFRVSIPPSRRAALRLLSSVRHQLISALAEEAKAGLSQADIARDLGVNRSVVHRFFAGSGDMMVGNVAELAWSMDREVVITIGAAGAGIRAHDIAAEEAPATNLIVPKDEIKKYSQEAYSLKDSTTELTVTPERRALPTNTSMPTMKNRLATGC